MRHLTHESECPEHRIHPVGTPNSFGEKEPPVPDDEIPEHRIHPVGTPNSFGEKERYLPVPDESGTTDQMNLVFRWMRIYSVRKSAICLCQMNLARPTG